MDEQQKNHVQEVREKAAMYQMKRTLKVLLYLLIIVFAFEGVRTILGLLPTLFK